MGLSNSRASVKNSMSIGMSWPSMGPTVARPKCSNQASSAMTALVASPAFRVGRRVEGLAAQEVAAGHADGGRDPGAGVADAEEVVRGLPGLRKPGHAGPRPQVLEERQAAGEQLVRVALVADVEEQAV